MNKKSSHNRSESVVLTPKDGVETVCKIMQRLDLQADIEHCPLLAMAELALLHQLRRNEAAWNSAPQATLLILINAEKMDGMQEMLKSLRHYLPDVEVSTIKDGQLQSINDNSQAVDALEDPPIIHAESIDADELSMLLDGSEFGVEE
jgi:hypothetical protein|tara:strand:- start:1445 stop:1888 length:444 start_codon:yes stop_codon:yes gene_type:complete